MYLKYTKVLIYCSLVKYIVANILTDLATVISSVQTISKENRTIPRIQSQILILHSLTSIISYLTQKVFLSKISFNGKINIPHEHYCNRAMDTTRYNYKYKYNRVFSLFLSPNLTPTPR